MARLVFLLAALFALLAAPALAHTRSESRTLWEINGRDVDLIVTLPDLEAARIAKGERPTDAELGAYLAGKTYPLASGQKCQLIPPIVTLSAAPGYRELDFTYRCPSAEKIEIHSDAFFELVPAHISFAQIQNAATGDFAEQLLTNEHRTAEVSADAASPLQRASFLEFIVMGIEHIFTGVDHMTFLLGLVLISRRLRDLVFVVTGFTLGHSITLALAVTGVVRPHGEYIEALVALTIALIGAENAAAATKRPGYVAAGLAGLLLLMTLGKVLGLGGLPWTLTLGAALFTGCYLMVSGHIGDAGRLRLVITLIFGLIHGFGFAASLLEMRLPTGRLAELLLGFNLGVEVGQLTLVVGVSLLVLALSRLKVAVPRPIVVDVSAAFLVAIGLYWFVGRAYA
jgi:hypothetical protein